MLDALQAKLDQFTDPDNQLIAAAYLYRYKRKSGYDKLVTLLQHSNGHAASILAANKDLPSLPVILERLPEMSDDHDLILSLGKWMNSGISAALLKEFIRKTNNSDLALALALQGNMDAIPIMKMNYDAAPDDYIRQQYALAFIRLKVKDSQNLFEKEIKPHLIASDPVCLSILDDMRYLELSHGISYSVSIVEQFIRLPPVSQNAKIFTSYGLNSLVASVNLLTTLNYSRARQLILAAMKKMYDINAYSYEDTMALIALRAGNSAQIIEKYSGENVVYTEIKIQALSLNSLPKSITGKN